MKLLYRPSMTVIFILLILLALTLDVETFTKVGYSQLEGNSQIWKDSENNVRILFNYSPISIVMNTPTELRFTIDDLRTGAAFKNVLITITIIGSNSSGQQKVIKFNGVSDNKGNYFINYAFPNLGMYQVIMRTKSTNPNFATLASFPLTVALETGLSNIAITGIIVVIAVAVSTSIVIRKRYR